MQCFIRPGADPGGGGPPLKLEKKIFFGVKLWFFTRNTPKMFTPPSLGAIVFFKCATLLLEILDPPLQTRVTPYKIMSRAVVFYGLIHVEKLPIHVLKKFLSYDILRLLLSPVYTIKVFHQKLCQSWWKTLSKYPVYTIKVFDGNWWEMQR